MAHPFGAPRWKILHESNITYAKTNMSIHNMAHKTHQCVFIQKPPPEQCSYTAGYNNMLYCCLDAQATRKRNATLTLLGVPVWWLSIVYSILVYIFRMDYIHAIVLPTTIYASVLYVYYVVAAFLVGKSSSTA